MIIPLMKGARRLLINKGYAVEMIESIIKETDLYLCAKQEMEDLGASGLFDLSRECAFPRLFYFFVYSSANNCNSFSSASAHEGASR